MSDRYQERDFTDGFNTVQGQRQGMSSRAARTHDVALTEGQCLDLSLKPELTVADWTDLTGVGRGVFGMYEISAECVEFRRWSDQDIRQSPSADQVDMEWENASSVLRFPCSSDALVRFVDQACIGGRHFELPGAFLLAVAKAHESPLITAERQMEALPAIEPSDSLRASVLPPLVESADAEPLQLMSDCGELEQADVEVSRQTNPDGTQGAEPSLPQEDKIHRPGEDSPFPQAPMQFAGIELEAAEHVGASVATQQGDADDLLDVDLAEAPRDKKIRFDEGVTKDAILAVFPPPRPGQNEEQWANMLGDTPSWLARARVDPGGKAIQSRWNPAVLAMCIAERKLMRRTVLGTLIRRSFPEYLDEWERYAGTFD